MPENNGNAAFVISRHFKLPRDVVWQAWSDSAQLQQWWGPNGCAIEVLRFEFQPGGFFHYAMNFDGALTWWGRFNYRQIVERESIVWLNSFANESGGIARAPFSEDCPLEIQNSVTFTEQDGQTTVTLHAQPFGALDVERQFFEDSRPSLEQGYGGTFDQLADYLARA
ncbi:uncharacterized protein YndB with AHSA1/START domain [Janthinobacterium sp. CG_23.3]|uniref:SRPBCC family protein n=1 Tax=unclassified Janthinobacterium TaxID=2610881 RepID=UPI000349F4C1|nr:MULTISPECIES: SRPBCC domain-containing protein [unclassified Janthinobacterium]MEC5161210.1 uncharacterized protein YndB with AHSA1/START domain [Janthinobacterium sp. CG_S6]